MTWWMLSFYLLVLLAAGAVFSVKKDAYPDRGTLFDRQGWSIWIGIFAATLLKSVSAIVLWSPWSFRNQPAIVPIYFLAEISVFVGILLFLPAHHRSAFYPPRLFVGTIGNTPPLRDEVDYRECSSFFIAFSIPSFCFNRSRCLKPG
ncbi:MAG: hypothetical protein MPW15_21865 [Candidatus Manganitrophus sp.]|nr:hypothetical protein [Candidatus Manganitrophus sp.]